jgi:hypothetical protein
MTIQWSEAVRDNMLDSWQATIGQGAKLCLYAGTMPPNCAAKEQGKLLVEFDVGQGWKPSRGGTKTFAKPLTARGLEDGMATYYRIEQGEDTCHEQGTISKIGQDGAMTLDNPNIAKGQIVRISSFTKIAAGE